MGKPRLPRPERRTAKDFLAVAGISIATAVLIGGAFVTADSRDVEHSVADSALNPSAVGTVAAGAQPTGFQQIWDVPNGSQALSTGEGGVLVQDGPRSVTVKNIATGEDVWSYTAPDDICGTAMNWRQTMVLTKTGKGCGEVVQFATSTGQYTNTRAALASDEVTVQHSNDNVGTVSDRRVELWRNDLVRTVEVGQVEAPAQPSTQKYAACGMGSALWRTDLLATIQNCTDEEAKEDSTVLRLMKTAPEESSVPEDLAEWSVPAGSVVVAIGQDRAVVYVPGSSDSGPEFRIFHEDGEHVDTQPAELSPLAEQAGNGFSAVTSDLPHHMTWWDGTRVVAFDPASMQPRWSVEDAVGTGQAMGDDALIPVADGIAVVNWNNGHVEKVIPVDRGEQQLRQVNLQVAGKYVVEQRMSAEGTTTAVLEAEF